MTEAEQQAYEVLLNEYARHGQKWEYLAHMVMVTLDCIETCIMVNKPEAAQMEIDNARRHFERISKEEAA